jgi:hypothetical protein
MQSRQLKHGSGIAKRGVTFLAWVGMLVGGAWFALRPLGRADGRFFFLPPRWAEWLDFHDWLVNFAALAVFAWLTMLVFGKWSMRWTTVATLVLLPVGMLVIEWLQMGIPGRSVDVTDVVAGSIGTIVGVGVGMLEAARGRKLEPERSGDGRRQT